MNIKLSCALVVLSGGQDSTTCLAMAKLQYGRVHAITFDYNQRHAREINAAVDVANLVGVDSHEIVRLGPILKGRSPLTDPEQPLETYTDFESMDKTIGDRVELTFVPMRNALFLTIAANRASCLGAEAIITGVCEADNANYPDCRLAFINAQQKAINAALGADLFTDEGHVTILSPLITLTKAESITALKQIGQLALLAFTHTAYDGKYPPVGQDHASTLRAQGFLDADTPDPLVIRAFMEGQMDLPDTPNYELRKVNEILPAIQELRQRLGMGFGA